MVILLTRPCRRCRHERFVPDEIARNQPTCRRCAARHWKRIHGTRRPCHGCGSRRKRPPRTRYCEQCRKTPEQQRREASMRYYLRLKQDPQRWAEHVEIKRMEDRLRRERVGKARKLNVETYEQRYGNGDGDGRSDNVDASPIARVVREWLDDERGHIGQPPPGLHTVTALAANSGVSARSLRRVLAGQEHCSLYTADRLATAIGTHLDVVYADAPGVRSTDRRAA